MIGKQKDVWKKVRTPEPLEISVVRTNGSTITYGIMYIIHREEPSKFTRIDLLENTPRHRLSLIKRLGPEKAVLANDRWIAPTKGVTINANVTSNVGIINS